MLTPTTISSGNISPLQADSKGSLRTVLQDAAGNVRGANVTSTNDLQIQANHSGATASAIPSRASYAAGNGSGNLTGITVCDNWTPINPTAGMQLITGASSKKTYICSINLVTATAQNLALVSGTGTTCATGTHAIAGGTTAGTGWNFTNAGTGLAAGTGVGVIICKPPRSGRQCVPATERHRPVCGAISWTQY